MPRGRRSNGRNPYGSRGGYVIDSARGGRRGLGRGGFSDFAEDMAGGRRMNYADDFDRDMARGRERGGSQGYNMNYANNGYNADYENGMNRGVDRQDGHYMGSQQGQTYYPVEAMGRFSGYWGGGNDFTNNDMRRGGRDRGYFDPMMRDSIYYPPDMVNARDYAGDYGEKLSKQELEEWKRELMQKVEEKDKQFFEMSNLIPKAKQLGAQMKEYSEEELAVVTALAYNDYCKTAKKYVGNNMDFFIDIAKDWLEDKESELTGGEKLAVYYDCIVKGEE